MADEFFNGNGNNDSDNRGKNPYERQNQNETNQNNGFGGSEYQNQNETNNNYQKQNNTDCYGRHECNNPYERHENSNRYDQNERDNPYVSGSTGSGANGFGGYNGNNSTNFGEQNPYANNNSGNELYADNKKPGYGFGIASMVLGILSLVCCCTAYFGIVFGVLGLIFGIISCKKSSNGFAIAGIITSSFGILIGIIMIFIIIFADGINWSEIFPFDSSWNFSDSEDSSFDPNTDAFVEIGKTIKNFLNFKR